ncbi:hypothetical protein AB0M47_12850 [Hamadaea sp. NPDC051192]|uniref:hypothetical protein n=1 Tax=Hamadaea sp. NPDC051192 TaxID=3154940 RepID=UPI00344885FD
MNVRQAITVVAAGALLSVGIGATPAYAEVVDLKAIPATASGQSGGDVAVTIAFEASAPISGPPPVVQLDVAFPAGAPIKVYPSPCKYWGTFKARCLLDSVTQGRHELTFQVVMPTTPSSTSTVGSTLTIKAPGYTEPTYKNNTASITLKLTASGSSSPSAARSATASAKATPKSSKRSSTPSAAPTEGGALPTEAVAAVADGQTTTTVDAAAVAENEDSDSLPVLIFGGAGALVVVGGLLLWLVLRRRNDDEDEEDEYDRYQARY